MMHGAAVRLIHNPLESALVVFFQRLKQAGVDSVAIIPHHYCYLAPGTASIAPPPPEWGYTTLIYGDYADPSRGRDPQHPFGNTPDIETVYAAVKIAGVLGGMNVLLKPHLDSYYGAWRGWISVKDRAADFFESYRRDFLLPYVQIARQLPHVALCVGCELSTVTYELGPEFWTLIAKAVRWGGFAGPLTYAANWAGIGSPTEYGQIAARGGWEAFDFIGVDAYFPLLPANDPGDPDLATLIAGWDQPQPGARLSAYEELTGFAYGHERPLLFTEIGYGNWQGAASQPFAEPPPGAIRDDALQARCIQAFRHRWEGAWEPQRFLAGYFLWETWLDRAHPPPAISDDVLDRPAEDVAWLPAGIQVAPSPYMQSDPPTQAGPPVGQSPSTPTS